MEWLGQQMYLFGTVASVLMACDTLRDTSQSWQCLQRDHFTCGTGGPSTIATVGCAKPTHPTDGPYQFEALHVQEDWTGVYSVSVWRQQSHGAADTQCTLSVDKVKSGHTTWTAHETNGTVSVHHAGRVRRFDSPGDRRGDKLMGQWQWSHDDDATLEDLSAGAVLCGDRRCRSHLSCSKTKSIHTGTCPVRPDDASGLFSGGGVEVMGRESWRASCTASALT